ncbi:MAG: hypothetical protein HY055_01860 [Magnetospirillum sp.]|nr:hypothetical protein [Magnetospirillum sp.]
MKIRLVAALAVLSVSLAGCVLDPYAMGDLNRYPQSSGYGYQQQSYQQSNVYIYQQAPPSRFGIGQSRVDVYGGGRHHHDEYRYGYR